MNNNVRVRKEGKHTIVSILILSGATLAGTVQSYTPDPNIRKQGIEQVYIKNNRYSQEKSEVRKQQLLQQIAEVRRQMRNVPLSKMHKGYNHTVTPNGYKVREALKSLENTEKLVNSIFA